MSPVHQEFDPVLFRRDRIVLRDLDDCNVAHIHLMASRRPGFHPDFPRHREGGFLRELFEPFKHLVRNGPLDEDPLEEAGTVPHHGKLDLSAGSLVVQPAADRDSLSNVAGQILNIDTAHERIPGGKSSTGKNVLGI